MLQHTTHCALACEALSFFAKFLIQIWHSGIIYYSSNFGKLNWYLGAGAVSDGRQAKYPGIDFCELFGALVSFYGAAPNAQSVMPPDCVSLTEQARTRK